MKGNLIMEMYSNELHAYIDGISNAIETLDCSVSNFDYILDGIKDELHILNDTLKEVFEFIKKSSKISQA